MGTRAAVERNPAANAVRQGNRELLAKIRG